MRISKRLLAYILCLAVFISTMAVTAYAASGTCEVFYFNEYGVGAGGTASIQTSLNNMGYTANRYADTHAYYVRRTMDQDKVFAIVTHGAPGYVVCGDGTTMSAKAVPDNDDNYSLAAWFGADKLEGMLFAYYGACDSADTSSTYGNLLTYTTDTLGAQCALGFEESVYDSHATYYEAKLFSYLEKGYSVNLSNILARSATYNNYGSYGEVDSAVISGTSATKVYTTATASVADIDEAKTSEIDFARTLFNSTTKTSLNATTSSFHDEVFEHDVDAVQDSNYLYLFNAEDESLETIVLINENNVPILGSISSSESAIALSEQFAMKASPEFFETNQYDVRCSVFGEGTDKVFSVEFWEKIADNYYTGNKIAVVLTSGGVLQSFVIRTESAIAASKVMVKDESINLDEESAVAVAYSAIAKTALQLEALENEANCVPKTGTDIIMTDSGKEVNSSRIAGEYEAYNIKVDDTQNQSVSAHKEIVDGVTCWIVTIENISTNRAWDMAFTVAVNAEDGSVISVHYTR